MYSNGQKLNIEVVGYLKLDKESFVRLRAVKFSTKNLQGGHAPPVHDAYSASIASAIRA